MLVDSENLDESVIDIALWYEDNFTQSQRAVWSHSTAGEAEVDF